MSPYQKGLAVARPNILLLMTDQERYAPPYESPELATFRLTQLPARARLRSAGLELHRHYAGSTACLPSRATLFTGQYPSLHGLLKPMAWPNPITIRQCAGWIQPVCRPWVTGFEPVATAPTTAESGTSPPPICPAQTAMRASWLLMTTEL